MSDSEPGNELYSLPILKFKEQASAILKAKEEYRGMALPELVARVATGASVLLMKSYDHDWPGLPV